MSPLPARDRWAEVALKGVHLGLRQVSQAPEQRRARDLARQARARVPEPDPQARRVAFLTPRDWAMHVQWEAVLGQALRLRGARVSVVTCGGGLEICDRANLWEAPPMPCTTCTRYVHGSLDAHGLERVSIRSGWQGDDVGWPELDLMSVTEMRSVELDGLPLGDLVDIPVKWFLMTVEEDEEPLVPITMRRFLRAGRLVAQGVEAALDRLRPDTVVLLNGLFFFESIAWELCRRRGIDVVTYERALIKETLVFKRGTPACLFDFSDAWQRWRDDPLTPAEDAELDEYLLERATGGRTLDKFWTAASGAGVEPVRGGGRRATMFTNLTWDSAVINQQVAFASIQDWVVATVELFRERPEHELVIRVHPGEVKLPGKQTREPVGELLKARYPTLPPNVRVVDAHDPVSSYPLMDATDVGLVFSSTTGLELALRGVPTIVAGRSHYRGRGFTIDVEDPARYAAEIDSVLADPASRAPSVDLARRYAYLFFFRAPIRFDATEEYEIGLSRILASDIDQLAPGADAHLDRLCDAILGGGPFEQMDR